MRWEKRIATRLVAVLLALGIQVPHPSVLQAALYVGAPVVVQPAAVPAGQTSQLTVTSQITSGPGDPPVLATGVNLLRIAASGQVLATLGVMRDDGANGDAAAGDGVFTLRVPVSVAVGDVLRLRVSAAFQGRAQRVLSTITDVPVGPGDITPPVVTITSPATGANLGATPTTVSGIVDDPTATVRVNGVVATLSGTSYTATGVTLQEGLNTLTASATDPAGNVGTASVQVRLDTRAPTLTILSPTNGSVVTQNPPNLQVTFTDDGSGVRADSLAWQVNGAPLAVACTVTAGGATCTPAAPLPSGAVTLRASVADNADQSTTAEVAITVGGPPSSGLTLDISSPAAGAIVGASPITVRGSASEPDAIITVQGALATVTGQFFAIDGLPLTEGLNRIAAVGYHPTRGTGNASRDVTLDSQPPFLRIVSPADRAIVPASPLTVTATVIDATPVTCTVNGATASVRDVQDGASGQRTVESGPLTLTPGPHVVAVACRDAAGHESVQRVTAYVDSDPLTVTGVTPAADAAGVATSAAVSVTFSDAIDAATVRDTSLYLRDGQTLIAATLAVSPDRRVATLTPAGPLPTGRTLWLTVTRGVSDAIGNPLSTPHLSAFSTAGTAAQPGDLLGETYDDTRSQPLGAVSIEARDAATGDVLAQGSTDERGRYLLKPGRVNVVLRLSKAGYTTVERLITTAQGTFAEVLDARLTPLAAARVVPVTGATLSLATGEAFVVPSDGLQIPASVRFTSVSPQGPRRPLPVGWSPLSIVDIQGLNALTAPATLRFTDRTRTAAGRNAAIARVDDATGEWRLVDVAVVPAAGPVELTTMEASGQFALVVPDDGADAPTLPGVGAALVAAPEIAVPIDAVGQGVVVPPVGRADDPTPAQATVTVRAETPLRSGTVLRGDFVEVVLLRAGGGVAPPQTGQDLIAYRALADATGQTLVAPFPITASRTFALTEITEGTVTVDLTRTASATRTLSGVAGGGVVSLDGARVSVPAGALPATLPIAARRFDALRVSVTSTPGAVFLGGVELDLFNAAAAHPLSLSLEGAAFSAPTGSSVVVAELRTVEGGDRLVPVAFARVEGDALTTVVDPGGGLPGVRTSGRYGFYSVDGPLEAVGGRARDTAGRRDGHSAVTEALPFVSVTDAVGAFALVTAPGSYAVVATAAGTLDRARVAGATGTPLAELVIGPTPPRLESIAVKPAPVEGRIAGPVMLVGRPAPLVKDDGSGGTQGNGNGIIEAGERVALTLTVRNDGNAGLYGGAFALRLRGTPGPVDVEPLTIPAPTLAPDVPTTVGPFLFTVPAGADASQLRYSLYHLADGLTAAREIAFELPLGVTYPGVALTSEITLRFSEPVTMPSLQAGVALVRESSSGDVAVPFRIVPGANDSVVILRLNEPLVDGSVHRLTLAPPIVDRDGRTLADAPVVERFSTIDRTPPPAIDPGQVTASMPDGEGYVTVTGSAGTVNPDDVVFLMNDDTGHSVLATVATDGSFTGRLLASLADRLVVIVRDRADNQTRFDVGPFIRRDPVTGEVLAAVVRQTGGAVERDGIRLDVPLGAMPGAAEVSVSRVTEPFELPVDIAASPTAAAAFANLFRPVARVRVDADIRRFASPVKLTIAAPAGATVGDLYLVVRSRQVSVGGVLADLDRITGLTAADNPVRTLERLEIVESATVKDDNGRFVLSTDSPPFDGLLEPGVLTFLEARGPVTFLAGEVRRDSATGRPIEGAIVRSLPNAEATSPFVAVAEDDGRFVLADAAAGGPYVNGDAFTSRLDVFDPQYSRVIRRDVRATVGTPAPPQVAVGYLTEPFVLPARLPREIYDVLGDLEPPTVTLDIKGPGLKDGFARVGQPITASVVAEDNDEVISVGLQVDDGGGYADIALDAARSYQFVPNRETVLSFRARARDRNGNTTFHDLLLRTVRSDSDDIVVTSLADKAPEWIPPPLWNPPCTFDGECLPRFTEPLDPSTVDVGSVRMIGPDGRPVAIKVAVDDRDGTLVRISPKRNLRFDSTYEIRIASSVRDLNGQAVPHEVRIICHVLPPVQVATIPLANVQDIALKDDGTLVAINHPVAAVNAHTTEPGRLHTFRVRDDDGNLLERPVALGSVEVSGRPLSLAVDGDRAWVGNRYLGDPGSAQAIFSPLSMLGMGLGGLLPGGALGMFPATWTDFPTVPSNLEVFDITDAAAPKSVGMKELNHLVPLDADAFRDSPTLWNPNTFPIRTQTTTDGIGVVNSYNNLELLSAADVPESRNIIERVDGPMVFPGRCQGGNNDGMACTISHLDPLGTLGRLQCGEAPCQRHDEFLNAWFLDESAVTLDTEGVRIVSTTGGRRHYFAPSDRTLGKAPVGGTGLGRVAVATGFKWESADGPPVQRDLGFVSGQNDRLTILDITDESQPAVLSSLALPSGNMAVDSCSGVVYLHTRTGTFHAIDFNDPKAPIDLNSSGTSLLFSTNSIAGGAGFGGMALANGVLHVRGSRGVAVVRVRNGRELAAPNENNETGASYPDYALAGSVASAKGRASCVGVTAEWTVLESTSLRLDDHNPQEYGGGYRVFPEKATPDAPLESTVGIDVSLVNVPTQGATVFARLIDMDHYSSEDDFDPYDPIACTLGACRTDGSGHDNWLPHSVPAQNGGAEFISDGGVRRGLVTSLDFSGSPASSPPAVSLARGTLRVNIDARQPGNNWVVALVVCITGAEPCHEKERLTSICVVPDGRAGQLGVSCGGSSRGSGFVHRTSLLTVWRSLNLQLVEMAYPTLGQLSEGVGRARVPEGRVVSLGEMSCPTTCRTELILDAALEARQFEGGSITLSTSTNKNVADGDIVATLRVEAPPPGPLRSTSIFVESDRLAAAFGGKPVRSFVELIDDDLVEWPDDKVISASEMRPDVSWLRRLLEPALVEVRVDPQTAVFESFRHNMSEGEIRTGGVCGTLAAENEPSYWLVCLGGAYQGPADRDGDPAQEGMLFGTADGLFRFGEYRSSWSLVFAEPIREGARSLARRAATVPGGGQTEWIRPMRYRYTAAHEVLHLMGLQHEGPRGESSYGTIMDYRTPGWVVEGALSVDDVSIFPKGLRTASTVCKPNFPDGAC